MNNMSQYYKGTSDKYLSTITGTHYHTRSQYCGAYAVDMLPNRKLIDRYPQFYYLNTGTLKSGGKHWTLAYFINHYADAIWFDSLGQKPEFYHINLKRFLITPSKHYVRNTTAVQDRDSPLCGQFVLMVADLLAMEPSSFQEVMSIFDSTPGNNDKMVLTFVDQHILSATNQNRGSLSVTDTKSFKRRSEDQRSHRSSSRHEKSSTAKFLRRRIRSRRKVNSKSW